MKDDSSVFLTGTGKVIEVQGTAEEAPFMRSELDALLDLAEKGIRELVDLQNQVLLVEA